MNGGTRNQAPITRSRYELLSCHVFKGLIKKQANELLAKCRRPAKCRKLYEQIAEVSEDAANLLLVALDKHPGESEALDYYSVHAFKGLISAQAEQLLSSDVTRAEKLQLCRRAVRLAIKSSEPMVARLKRRMEQEPAA